MSAIVMYHDAEIRAVFPMCTNYTVEDTVSTSFNRNVTYLATL